MNLCDRSREQIAESAERLREAIRSFSFIKPPDERTRLLLISAKALTDLLPECGVVMTLPSELPSEHVVGAKAKKMLRGGTR